MDGATMWAEMEHEAAITRRFLERVPLDQVDWKPHEKSMTLGELTFHLADIPSWVPVTVNQDVFEMEAPYEPQAADTVESLLEIFDRNVAGAKEALAGVGHEALMAPWTMKHGGEVVFSMPKVAVLNAFCTKHTVHHRAQLGVYLRLLDVPVPSTYGPSADEQG